jgi:hypothetical protein
LSVYMGTLQYIILSAVKETHTVAYHVPYRYSPEESVRQRHKLSISECMLTYRNNRASLNRDVIHAGRDRPRTDAV